MHVVVCSFYKFAPLNAALVEELHGRLTQFAGQNDLYGLVLLACEGINATVAGTQGAIDLLKDLLALYTEFGSVEYKYSFTHKIPFRRFKVDLREEIVTSGDPELKPWLCPGNKLSPQEWQRVLDQEKDFVLIDTRNKYETELGLFKGALDPQTSNFGEFKEFAEGLKLSKQKKILIYCTGGIRCEKAAIELQQAGFEQVFQLEGGILKYLEQYPNSHFEGECFVFDHRVALDQELKPSQRFGLCPHCGNPAQQTIQCANCAESARVCRECSKLPDKKTCSKNCAYHVRRLAQAA